MESLYYIPAREAVRLEQEGKYTEAAELWKKALRKAKKSANRHWCRKRRDFCQYHNVRQAYTGS